MNKIALIIPSRDQEEYWDKILKGIALQTRQPDKVYILLDRPTDEVMDKASKCIHTNVNFYKFVPVTEKPKYIGNPPKDKYKELFLTPYIRNLGIEMAIKDGYDTFIFIDGDCIPQNKLIESHLRKLRLHLPILTVGRRRELMYRWMDRREYVPELSHLNLFQEKGTLINSPDLLKQSLIVWSCNIGMNLLSINMLKNFNRFYYDRAEVFSSEFNGSWGGEDAFLGIQAYYTRLYISTIGEKASGIEHINHPRPDDKYNIDHMNFLNKQIDILRKKVRIRPLDLKFFEYN